MKYCINFSGQILFIYQLFRFYPTFDNCKQYKLCKNEPCNFQDITMIDRAR